MPMSGNRRRSRDKKQQQQQGQQEDDDKDSSPTSVKGGSVKMMKLQQSKASMMDDGELDGGAHYEDYVEDCKYDDDDCGSIGSSGLGGSRPSPKRSIAQKTKIALSKSLVNLLPSSPPLTMDDDDQDLQAMAVQRQQFGGTNYKSQRLTPRPRLEFNKVVVMILLIFVGVLAMIATYTFSTKQDLKDFEKQFDVFAMEIIDISSIKAASVFATIQSMTLGITSYVIDSNTNGNVGDWWPFVTIPHYESKSQIIMDHTGASQLSFVPLLQQKDNDQIHTLWEDYSKNHQDWIQEGLDYQYVVGGEEEDKQPYTASPIPSFVIPVNATDTNSMVVAAPTWQIAPAPKDPGMVNYNQLSSPSFRSVFTGMVQTNQPVFTEVITRTSPTLTNSSSISYNVTDGEDEHEGQQQLSPPSSSLIYPIYDRLVGDVLTTNNTTTTSSNMKRLVGYIDAIIPWHVYFEDLLPINVQGVILVLSDTCGSSSNNNDQQYYTYEMNGHEVIFIGDGDLHDDKYDDLEVVANFYSPTIAGTDDVDDDTSTSSAGGGPHCSYTYHLYPSDKFKEAYTTRRSIYFTTIVVVIFVLTFLVFVLYDTLSRRKQKKAIANASRANDLVESLFPANVRERLMEEAAANNSKYEERSLFLQPEMTTPLSGKSRPRMPKRLSGILKSQLRLGLNGSNEFTLGSNNSTTNLRQSDSVTNSIRSDMLDEGAEEAENERILQSAQKTPIADFFPKATVLFADLVGFTAWSSVREPSQVFRLLETLYNAFDMIARRSGIFKVETIGDCYMAASGLPEPRPDHALAMAKFALDCKSKMKALVLKLEKFLGPGTADLQMRVGLHSGPVTAGVLRGDRSRFQLFGDTVNTAARMETTGAPNCIHLSQECASLLIDDGHSDMVQRRETTVTAKGKGELQTYWLVDPSLNDTKSSFSSSASSPLAREPKPTVEISNREETPALRTKPQRDTQSALQRRSTSSAGRGNLRGQLKRSVGLARMGDMETRMIDYNVEVLSQLLKRIMALRIAAAFGSRRRITAPGRKNSRSFRTSFGSGRSSNRRSSSRGGEAPKITEAARPTFVRDENLTILEEAADTIAFPNKDTSNMPDIGAVELSPSVKQELHHYVKTLSSLYRFHSFHCFEHASHTTQSVTKMLHRVNIEESAHRKGDSQDDLRNRRHSYMSLIESDPLTQFAMAFSALIHHVDHYGVPNAQLVKEKAEIVELYGNQCVAEQNSVNVAWGLLMENGYEALRGCIYTTQTELNHFRQVLVTCVMATDVSSRSLTATRGQRWKQAFETSKHVIGNEDSNDPSIAAINMLRATLVVETMMQASNMAHTMQHWQVYVKWNERLFAERYRAFVSGREATDPAKIWYNAELCIFDNFIIPLAQKLKDENVFGDASEEYLTYALSNRKEWEANGQEIVQRFLETYSHKPSFMVLAKQKRKSK